MTCPTGLPALMVRSAERFPERPFLTWRGESTMYRDATEMMLRAGHALKNLDETTSGNGRIILYLGNCPEAVYAWLGCQAVGLEPVTLNNSQRGDVLADMVNRIGSSVVVTDRAGLGRLREAGAVDEHSATLLTDHSEEGAPSFGEHLRNISLDSDREVIDPDPESTASILFSSGTTGRSKAVVVPHGMFDAGTARLMESWKITEHDVFHSWAPYFHIAAQMDVFGIAIRAGASVAMFEGFSLSQFWDQIRACQATVFGGFVSILELLYAAEPTPDDLNHNLRMGIAGHIPASLRANFERRFGVRMVDAYGMSEAEPITAPGLDDDLPDGSCGRATSDFEVRIHDRNGEEVPFGELGQIVFRPLKPNVMMSGYLDDPDRTARSWRDGWFQTGDLGRMDSEGRIYFAERMADFIRVRGENVSPQEVETALLAYPGIVEVGVVGIPSELGEHDIKAVIVVADGTDLSGLFHWSRQRMAKFMVPRYVQIVDALPRTETSKIRREALRKLEGDLETESTLLRQRTTSRP